MDILVFVPIYPTTVELHESIFNSYR